ncbi:hypothetical protein QTN25_003061 [Entamoeba marina]
MENNNLKKSVGKLIIDTQPPKAVLYRKIDRVIGASYTYLNDGKLVIAKNGKIETVEMTQEQRAQTRQFWEKQRRLLEQAEEDVRQFQKELDENRFY